MLTLIKENPQKSTELRGVKGLLEVFNLINPYGRWPVELKLLNSRLESLKYSLQDIEKLCPEIAITPNTGYFISAAINNKIEDGETVTLNFNGAKVDAIGRFRKGNVILKGDAGSHAGAYMSGSARLTIYGNTGGFAGEEMSGSSKLTIYGNTKAYLGNGMKGSASITVYGNAEYYVGGGMSGFSQLTIHGNITEKVGTGMSGSAHIILYPNPDSEFNLPGLYANLLVDLGEKSYGGRIDVNPPEGMEMPVSKTSHYAEIYTNGKREPTNILRSQLSDISRKRSLLSEVFRKIEGKNDSSVDATHVIREYVNESGLVYRGLSFYDEEERSEILSLALTKGLLPPEIVKYSGKGYDGQVCVSALLYESKWFADVDYGIIFVIGAKGLELADVLHTKQYIHEAEMRIEYIPPENIKGYYLVNSKEIAGYTEVNSYNGQQST